MAKKLEVKNLTISFKTMNGKVQAVRDISFDLEKGETLAIVGESGSGKSVTSKAIIGISAVNAMIESGEILYDGQDLTKIKEEQFHKLRGNKIAMIFQDPLSSLNPIVRIGRQLTEAMLLKGKANQREARKSFNDHLAVLRKYLDEIYVNEPDQKVYANEMLDKFNQFETLHTQIENKYNIMLDHLYNALHKSEELSFKIEKKAAPKLGAEAKVIIKEFSKSYNEYLIKEDNEEYNTHLANLKKNAAFAGKLTAKNSYESETVAQVKEDLDALIKIGRDLLAEEQYNFFTLAYFLTFGNKEPLPDLPIAETNEFLKKYLDDHFMLDFVKLAEQALKYGRDTSNAKKAEIIKDLDRLLETYKDPATFDIAAFKAESVELNKKVIDAFDNLDFKLNNTERTFPICLNNAIGKYQSGITNNAKEEKRFEKQTQKFDMLVAKGKQPDWKVVPKSLVKLEAIHTDIISILTRLKALYEEEIERFSKYDLDRYHKRAIKLVDYFKEQASLFVHKVTPNMAKDRAIKLMEEVGIQDARSRYYRYPFEFSGGMRQRIVIAIALAANPDILICDEPTTALDVTIQSQILELINKIKKERDLSIIFITHDLGVVANMADRVAVMYAGKIVEYGTANDIFYEPRHPYTWALLSSMPDLETNERLEAIPGTPPNMIYPPVGDAFAARNKYAMKIDFEKQPPLFKITDTHYAATWLLHPDAPDIEMPKIVQDRIKRMKEETAKYMKEKEGGQE